MLIALALLLAAGPSDADACPAAQRARLEPESLRAQLLRAPTGSRRKDLLHRLGLSLPEPCREAPAKLLAVELFTAALTSEQKTDVVVQVALQTCGVEGPNGIAYLIQVLRPISSGLWCRLGNDLSATSLAEDAARARAADVDAGAGSGVDDSEGGIQLAVDGLVEEMAQDPVEAGTAQTFRFVELLEPGRQVIETQDFTVDVRQEELHGTLSYWSAGPTSLRRVFSTEVLHVIHAFLPREGEGLTSDSAEVSSLGDPPQKLRVSRSTDCVLSTLGSCAETSRELWEFKEGQYEKTREIVPTWEF